MLINKFSSIRNMEERKSYWIINKLNSRTNIPAKLIKVGEEEKDKENT